jgi:phosphoinositide-3-kinase regulatory subunit 4
MPILSYIEKIWITFQLLIAVKNLVSLDLVHGDLKPENILLTSNLSVYISDIGSYKPAYILMDDITNYTYYFGSNNSADMGGCYLAPERLIEKGEYKDNDKYYSMDIFSLGVIIAELFLEQNLFDFSSLLNYKKGNKELFNIDEILIKISNEKLRKLI